MGNYEHQTEDHDNRQNCRFQKHNTGPPSCLSLGSSHCVLLVSEKNRYDINLTPGHNERRLTYLLCDHKHWKVEVKGLSVQKPTLARAASS